MLQINDKITISADHIKIRYIRSRGPGGQNVNKVSTRAQLMFDLKNCDVIPDAARKRLAKSAGRRLTEQGILIMESDRFRHQGRNRQETLNRLAQLIRKALVAPKVRRATKPTASARRRRLADKKHRGKIKSLRQEVTSDE